MSDDKPEAEKPDTNAEAETKAAEPVEAGSTAADEDKPTPEADEAEPTDSERSALQMTAKPKADKPTRDGTAQENHGHGHSHGHGDHAHGDGHDHGLAHTTPVWLLFGVLGALLVLTVATVAVTSVDLGAQNNLIVAMVIATVKAA